MKCWYNCFQLKATLFLVLGCSWCHLAEAKDPFFQPRRNSRQLINDPSFIPLGDQVPLEPVEHRGLPEPPLLDDDPFGYLLQTTTEAMTDDSFEPASPPPPYVEPTPSVTEQYPYEQVKKLSVFRAQNWSIDLDIY